MNPSYRKASLISAALLNPTKYLLAENKQQKDHKTLEEKDMHISNNQCTEVPPIPK